MAGKQALFTSPLGELFQAPGGSQRGSSKVEPHSLPGALTALTFTSFSADPVRHYPRLEGLQPQRRDWPGSSELGAQHLLLFPIAQNVLAPQEASSEAPWCEQLGLRAQNNPENFGTRLRLQDPPDRACS